MTDQTTKKRLFIVAGTFTTAIASALIKQLNQKNCEDYLVSIAPTLYENLDNHIKSEATQLNLFKQILFYFDFCKPKKEVKNEKTHILSFNIQKFKEATNHIEFDEIYSVYIHGAANFLFNQYPNANLYFIEDGVATYLKMENSEIINKRAKKIYTINYFNKIRPYITLKENVKTESINPELIKNTFKTLARKINFIIEKKEKSIIFCAQNISINNIAMKYDEELKLYEKNIKYLLEKGYCVYFKEHPKTPNMFFTKLQKQINNPNFINLNQYNVLPIELLAIILKPFAIVSMFSSALLTLPHLFDIPTFTFFADNEFKNHEIFGIAHLLVAEYIPPIDLIDKDLFKTRQAFDEFIEKQKNIENQAIYNIKIIDFFKLFISKKEFFKLKKEFIACEKNKIKYANIKPEILDIYENQTYLNLILYYLADYKIKYNRFKQELKKKNKLTAIFEYIKKGFIILYKLSF